MLIAIHAGLRIGEVSALRIEDICLSRRLIVVDESLNRVMTYNEDGTVCCPLVYQTTKSSRVRKVPMNEELYEGIVKALEKKKERAGSYEDRVQACRRTSGNRWNTVRRTISRWRPTAEGPH